MDEMIAVIDEEIALYEIREKYEEAVGGHCWHGIMGWCGGGGGRG